jgi:pyochelin biosynthesis protein PchG
VRVVVCGTGFGRIYLAALRRPGMPFELAGILARGSPRSRACAEQHGVPLYTDPDRLPAGIDVACVVVSAGINGGPGARLSQRLLARGIHVLQEHPLHQDELAACLREAHRSRVVYHLNTHYVHVEAVRRFLAAARRLAGRQPVLFVDALCSFLTLNPMFDVLGQALGSPQRCSFPGPTSGGGVYRGLDGVIAGVPVSLRVQNQLAAGNRDNGAHLLFRIALGSEGGHLLLASPHGPVLWHPRPHMPEAYRDAVSVEATVDADLDLPSVSCLGPDRAPSYRRILEEEWPAATARALLDLRSSILGGEDPRPRGQYQLALCRLTAEVTGRLGPPELLRTPEPQVVGAADLA